MSIAFLGTHVADFQVVTPTLGVFLLVLDAISLDSPFPRTFPFHDTTTFIGSEDDDKFASTSQPGIAAVSATDIYARISILTRLNIFSAKTYSFATLSELLE